jgi:hypothetical protein
MRLHLGKSEILVPADMPSAKALFIDPQTHVPMRWMMQVEVMDMLPMPGRVFCWQSNTPARVFTYVDATSTVPVQVTESFRGINPMTGLPNAFELRDLALRQAGLR